MKIPGFSRLAVAVAMLLAAVCLAQAAQYTPATVPDVHRADRNDFVANTDGILSAETVARLNDLLARMRADLTVEPMVVAVDAIDDPSEPGDFATDLFELWGLGKADKDNGLLILMVKDARKVVIRPGYGLEGALPDITCGRIIRDVFAPAAAAGDYDAAMLASVRIIDSILSDPETAAEYRSAAKDADKAAARDDGDDVFRFYLLMVCLMTVCMLAALALRLWSLRGRTDYEKYVALGSWKSVYLILTAAGIFIPAVASVPLLLLLNHWRNHARSCPNCGSRMQKVDEVHDNDYLTPAQDLEERIGSVDYDVWLCDSCGETDILAYTLPSSTYVECDNCHARTARPIGYRVVTKPTATRPGRGVKEYECLNCHNRMHRHFDIAPDAGASMASAAAAGAILGGMGRGGGFGGGSIGGGFGGGHTGGGGATGGW